VWGGGAKWSASCVGVPSRSPEVPVRLAPGKVCQESERPEASPHEVLNVERGALALIGQWCQRTPGNTSSPSSEKTGS
jgi:hypothetical protein